MCNYNANSYLECPHATCTAPNRTDDGKHLDRCPAYSTHCQFHDPEKFPVLTQAYPVGIPDYRIKQRLKCDEEDLKKAEAARKAVEEEAAKKELEEIAKKGRRAGEGQVKGTRRSTRLGDQDEWSWVARQV